MRDALLALLLLLLLFGGPMALLWLRAGVLR